MNDKGASFVRRKRKENKFTQLSNDMLQDERLSWKARGLLSYMLSMPDDWVFYETELINHSKKDGITSLRSAMKELKEIGYVKKEGIRDENGRIKKWVTYVDEEPLHQITENLDSSKPTMWESHNVENQTLLILNNTNNNKNNIKPSRQKYETSDMDNANMLFEMMRDNNPSIKQPNLEQWANEFRLIRERDNRTDQQIKYLIDWTQRDTFWKSNILSPSKLRKQWDQLVMKCKEQKQKSSYQQPQTFRFSEVAQEQTQINKWGIEG